jgi:HEPN domain-containing protein
MRRADLKKLADLRAKEAAVLLKARRPSGAYYLAGYSIECALKACIATQFKRSEFPDKKLVNDSYIHDLSKLLGLAGLKTALEADIGTNPDLEVNWAVVKDWSETRRYELISRQVAQDMCNAVSALPDGVLPWVKQHW